VQETSGLQLRSKVKREGKLELSLVSIPVPQPEADEVVIRVQACPINPSDIGMLFGPADLSTVTATGTPENPVITADIPAAAMASMAARIDQSLPAGNEGAGTVVAAGSSPAAQALMGKTVAVIGAPMFSQYRCIAADQCLVLPDDATAIDGASCFVNPLTALGMVETMRLEGHTALVHTAAASNLGQMLNRICLKDGIDLVNIVRKPEQAEILKELGAKYVCNSSTSTFTDDLTEALAQSGATIAFDALGGGSLQGQILACMEAAITRNTAEFNRYGSTVLKQLYIYGGLNTSPTELKRNFGFSWSMGGWLLFMFLKRIGSDGAQALRQRVADELKTTFASSYTKEVTLAEALQVEEIAVYGKRATGLKYLIRPND